VIINSKENQFFKYLKKLKNNQKKEKQFLAEGENTVRALCEKLTPAYLLFPDTISEKNTKSFYELQEKYPYKILKESIFSEISNLTTAGEILGIFPKFEFKSLEENIKNIHKILILENIQDPGNVGTLIRTAALLGWNNIILLDNCCDIFSSKVVRGSSGAIAFCDFYEPPRSLSPQTPEGGFKKELLNLLIENNFEILCATGSHPPTPLEGGEKKITLLLGNEGSGLDKFWIENKKTKNIKIPMQEIPQLDSLNVSIAGAILMKELSDKITFIHN